MNEELDIKKLELDIKQFDIDSNNRIRNILSLITLFSGLVMIYYMKKNEQNN